MENDGRQLIYVQNGSPKMNTKFLTFPGKSITLGRWLGLAQGI